jgi:creatinine amidohydrolase
MMAEMSWTDIEEAITSGIETVIFACGATEQHGPHLPLNVDTLLGEEVCRRAALKLGDALVAPPLHLGISDEHLSFPGSLTVRFETFVMILEDLCRSLAQHGFKRIVLISSHGGNNPLMTAYVPRIAKELAPRAQVFMAMPRQDPEGKQAALHKEFGIARGVAGNHAGHSETSRMLAIRPDLVQMEKAVPGRREDEFYSADTASMMSLEQFVHGMEYQTRNGVLGDPISSSAAFGDRLFDLLADSLARQVRQLQVYSSKENH